MLSAAEIKAIASGNPQVLRKVQLESEIARMERVRAVWRDTLVNLRIEHAQTTDSRTRLAKHLLVWEQASDLAVSHPGQPFAAYIATSGALRPAPA